MFRMERLEQRNLLAGSPSEADSNLIQLGSDHAGESEYISTLTTDSSSTNSEDYTVVDDFPVFEWVNTVGPPDLDAAGFKPIHILTTSFFWASGENIQQLPTIERIRQTTGNLDPKQMFVIDIEHWPTSGPSAADSVEMLTAVIRMLREVHPTATIGFYRLLPVRDYWSPVLDKPESVLRWDADNAALKTLAQEVDVIFPSIYTFYPDYRANGDDNLAERARWVDYAIENLTQARQYGKPVVPFVFTAYHGGGGSTDPGLPNFRYWKFQLIGTEFWETILDTIYEYGDGMVIFDSGGLVPHGEPTPRQWDDAAPWWPPTEKFLADTMPIEARSQGTSSGSLTGTLADVGVSDDLRLVIQEVPSNSDNQVLRHVWKFDVPNGAKSLIVEGSKSSENLQWHYSVNQSPWVELNVQLTSTEESHKVDFPSGISGSIRVRVRDAVRAHDNSADEVRLDRVLIQPHRPSTSNAPNLSIADVSFAEGDVSSVLTDPDLRTRVDFTVTLDNASNLPTAVVYEARDASATSPADYLNTNVRVATIPPGQTQKNISFVINGDTIGEPNESFLLEILGTFNAVATQSNATATITDDDEDDGTTVAGFTIIESDGGTSLDEGGSDNFDVVLNAAPSSDVVLSITSKDSSVATVTPTSLTFTSDNWSVAQPITIHGVDGDASVRIRVAVDVANSDPAYGSVSGQRRIATVKNVAPVAKAGGPYNVQLGSVVMLDATNSSDLGTDELSFAWDFDDDGQFDDATGAQPEFMGSQVGTFTVRVQVTDGDEFDEAMTTVTVIVEDSPDLIGLWKFDESGGSVATDSSGSGNHGTLVNGPSFQTGGRLASALSFDGVDDYVDVSPLDVTGNQMAITAWVNVDSFAPANEQGRILSKATGNSGQQHFWMLSTVSVKGELRLRARVKTNGVTTTLTAGSGVLAENHWYHVAFVYDGLAMKLYLDGAEVGSKEKTGAIDADPGVQAWIGDNPTLASSRPFSGLLDDVRLYDRAVTSLEILALAVGSESPVLAIAAAVLSDQDVAMAVVSGFSVDASETPNMIFTVLHRMSIDRDHFTSQLFFVDVGEN